MKKILLYLFLLSTVLGYSPKKDNEKEEVVIEEKDITAKAVNLSSTTTSLTVLDVAKYLYRQKEHYPLSDEFMERYQQNSGGYLDYAKEINYQIDKYQFEPNQKFHFFTSWLDQCVMEDPSILQQDGKRRVYTNILCPELLLWTMEACNAPHEKLLAALKVAEDNKAKNANVRTAATAIKACVPWDDMEATIRAANISQDIDKHYVSYTSSTYTITGLNSDGYSIGEKVSFKIDNIPNGKVVDTVSAPGVTLKNNYMNYDSTTDSYFFYMPTRNLELSVTFKDGSSSQTTTDGGNTGNNDQPVSSNTVDSIYSISYDLGTRTTAKAFDTTGANNDILSMFTSTDTNIISSISAYTMLSGGGNGGSNETKWYSGDMLKISTTSVKGSITFALTNVVNTLKITCYVYDTSAKIRVGNSSASDFNTSSSYLFNGFAAAGAEAINKDIFNQGKTVTVTISFPATASLTIQAENAKPIFITSLEFIYNDSTN